MIRLRPFARLVLGGIALAALGLLALPAAAASPPPGSLDPSWGGGTGYVLGSTSFPGVQGLAMQANKVIAVGGDFYSNNGDFVVSRFNNDGSPDTSFGGTGTVKTDFDGGTDLATSVALQGDRIVVAGYTCDAGFTYCQFALARYLKNGALDPSFNGTGQVTTAFGDGQDFADAVVVKGDKIVAAGYAGGDFALARYEKNGTLDSSFGGDGLVTTDFDGGFDAANGVAYMSDRIVAAGYANYPGSNFAVARYEKDGSLDTSFGGTGKVETDFAGGNDAGHAIDIKGNRILVVGSATVGTQQFAAVLYTKDGNLDPSFNSTGKTTMSVGPDAVAYSGAFGPGDTVVADGYTCFSCSFTFSGNEFGVARWTKDGLPDTSFGGTGFVTTPVGGSDSGASALVIAPGNKIVAGGYSDDFFAIARYFW
jgi:uncharacterized delta-60 repeat protein